MVFIHNTSPLVISISNYLPLKFNFTVIWFEVISSRTIISHWSNTHTTIFRKVCTLSIFSIVISWFSVCRLSGTVLPQRLILLPVPSPPEKTTISLWPSCELLKAGLFISLISVAPVSSSDNPFASLSKFSSSSNVILAEALLPQRFEFILFILPSSYEKKISHFLT